MTTTYDFGSGPVPAHQHLNGGGWVADTARVSDTAYVGPDAEVYGRAQVYGNARVSGNVRVSGSAEVYGRAWVYGVARVNDDTWTWGNNPAPSLDTQRELAARILAQVEADPTALDMAHWHCGSSHCIAGWTQVLSGDEPDDETAYGAGVRFLPAVAPWFHATEDAALAALRELVKR